LRAGDSGGIGWSFPDGAMAPDASTEVARVLRTMYRLNVIPSEPIEPDSAAVASTVRPAIFDVMEAEGLIARVEGDDERPCRYCLTAEGRRIAASLCAAGGSPVLQAEGGGEPVRTEAQPFLAVSERCLERQRAVVDRLTRLGKVTDLATALLQQFESSQSLLRKIEDTLTRSRVAP